MDSQFCKHLILAMFQCCGWCPGLAGSKQALHMRIIVYYPMPALL